MTSEVNEVTAGNSQPLEQPVPISGLLTLIITTSPTPSAPSTDLFSTIFGSFRKHCGPLFQCRVIVVFDTYDRITVQSRLKKGQVTPELAEHYDTYKVKAKDLVLREFGTRQTADQRPVQSLGAAEFGSPCVAHNKFPLAITQTEDERVTFIEPAMRLGFALAIRSSLRLTKTPYVWIQQHDWSLAVDIPIAPILEIMQTHHASDVAPIRYVCLSGGRMREHERLDHVVRFPALRGAMVEHRGDFSPPSQPTLKIPLTPLFFWHDKPHIASTEHYLARIFPSHVAVLRGSFIEDTVGHRARAQMKEGMWAKWASWLYYPDEGRTACLIHLKGRTWRGVEFAAEQQATILATRKELARVKALARTSYQEVAEIPSDFDGIAEAEPDASRSGAREEGGESSEALA